MANSDIRWGVPSDGHTFPIYAGTPDDMDRVAEYADERGVTNIRFGGDTWELKADKGPRASAVTGTGEWTVLSDADSFAKGKTYTIKADRHEVTLIAESRSDFVLDIAGEKVGQFTAANRGLRNLHVEFEGSGVTLPLDVQVFISWVARRCLETRTLNSTWAWTIALLLCIPLIVLYWIGAI